jgi:hypothetical protein
MPFGYAPDVALQFRQYLESGTWQCACGGAHVWLHTKEGAWQCSKCGEFRQFPESDYGVYYDVRDNIRKQRDLALLRAQGLLEYPWDP